jgi:hypothetical protein
MNFTEDSDKVRNRCPCEGCDHFDLCKTKELACRSFAKFVVDNYYYKDFFRDPCKSTFNKIFYSTDDALHQFVREWKGENKTESNTEK